MYKPQNSTSIFLCIIFFLFCSSVFANSLEKGISYYENNNFDKAFPIIKTEALKGDSEAQFLTAKMYESGKGTKLDLKQAAYWYSKGAMQGNSKAQNNLANLYADGKGVKKNLYKAVKLYLQSAKQGNSIAQNNLGLMYRKGEGTKKDYSKSLYWNKKAAEQGDIYGIHAVGLAYHLGMGVPVDRSEAIKWYKRAADKGFTPSMWNLSTLYLPEDNPGDAKRWDEVYKWYAMGMQHGDKKDAPFGMGLIYVMGWGNYPKDYPKASQLFTLAAENGKADGWYWLGVMEENGFGRAADKDKASELYRKAASLGSDPAIRRLNRETSGTGVMQSLKELISPLQ